MFSSEPVRAHLIQIAIISNHLNGKDTHVRGLKVLAPQQYVHLALTRVAAVTDECFSPKLYDGLVPFTSPAFKQHATIR